MKTETKYLEPVGFDGTKGKWEGAGSMVHFPFEIGMWGNDFYDSNQPFKMAKVFGNTEEQAIANAKLISQSKELAKALQDMIKMNESMTGCLDKIIDKIKSAQSEDIPLLLESVRKLLTHPTENAKQVLKDAGLSDK